MVTGKEQLKHLTPYVAGKPIDEVKREYGIKKVVKLASNENPYGCSVSAIAAMMDEIAFSNLYPDGYGYALRRKLCEKLNIPPEQLIFGTGSDGLIELIGKTFLSPTDEAVVPTPSFSLYETNTVAQGAKAVMVELGKDHKMNLPKMLGAITDKTKVVWLCNPNNPTGTMIGGQAQEEFISKIREDILIVIDEAYYEYAKTDSDYPDSLKMMEGRDNVLVLRTFSKAYGLAGLRVGYGIGSENLIGEMEKVRAPFNVSSLGQAAATAALGDQDFIAYTQRLNEENKQFLYRELDRIGLSYILTYTNFIMVCVNTDEKKVAEGLLKKGYIVKGGHSLGMEKYIRVTIGQQDECVGFIRALEEVLKEA